MHGDAKPISSTNPVVLELVLTHFGRYNSFTSSGKIKITDQEIYWYEYGYKTIVCNIVTVSFKLGALSMYSMQKQYPYT